MKMKYKAYKLKFNTPLHIGKTRLHEHENIISADTLFSALCNEALLLYGKQGIQKLISYLENDRLRFTDTMPFHKDIYYIPKPIVSMDWPIESDSLVRKMFKKLNYIDSEKIDAFFRGELDPEKEARRLEGIGKAALRTMNAIDENQKVVPYQVGIYSFNSEDLWGLYFLLGYESDDEMYFIEDLLCSLELSGIGGKKSAGFGKFTLKFGGIPQAYEEALRIDGNGGIYETLSISMAEDDKLAEIMENAQYALIRRGGFVFSETYAKSLTRKRDYYMFKAGSTFRKTFEGVLADVSSNGGHPVYRYGKPIFLEIRK